MANEFWQQIAAKMEAARREQEQVVNAAEAFVIESFKSSEAGIRATAVDGLRAIFQEVLEGSATISSYPEYGVQIEPSVVEGEEKDAVALRWGRKLGLQKEDLERLIAIKADPNAVGTQYEEADYYGVFALVSADSIEFAYGSPGEEGGISSQIINTREFIDDRSLVVPAIAYGLEHPLHYGRVLTKGVDF